MDPAALPHRQRLALFVELLPGLLVHLALDAPWLVAVVPPVTPLLRGPGMPVDEGDELHHLVGFVPPSGLHARAEISCYDI